MEKQADSPQEFQLQWNITKNVLTIRPNGMADFHSTPLTKLVTLDLLELNPKVDEVNLDLSESIFIDSTFLGFMIRLIKHVREREAFIRVIASDRNITKVFEITGFDHIVPLHSVNPAQEASDYEWQQVDAETYRQTRHAVVFHQLGQLAQQIDGGLLTHREQAFQSKAAEKMWHKSLPLEKLRRRTAIEEQLMGATLFVRITNGGRSIGDDTKKIMQSAIENEGVTQIFISFKAPSYMDKEYTALLLDSIQQAGAAGKKVLINHNGKPDDIIPTPYHELMQASGQLAGQ